MVTKFELVMHKDCMGGFGSNGDGCTENDVGGVHVERVSFTIGKLFQISLSVVWFRVNTFQTSWFHFLIICFCPSVYLRTFIAFMIEVI